MSNQYGPRIVTNGLVLCLDAGNSKSYPGSGTVWTDLSGNANNGTLTNGPTYSSDNKGSIAFDGVNDYVSITSSFIHPSTSSFTISFWCRSPKKSNTNFHSFISSRQLVTPFTGILITQDFTSNRSDYLRVQLNSTTSINQYNSGTIQIPNNIFCNITIAVDRSSNLMLWYINAVFDSQYNIANLGSILSNHVLELGRDEAFSINSNGFLNGRMANISIYNRALSASEVLQNYNATKGRFI